MISFFSLSELERKQSNLCLLRMKLPNMSSFVRPIRSNIYLLYSATEDCLSLSVSSLFVLQRTFCGSLRDKMRSIQKLSPIASLNNSAPIIAESDISLIISSAFTFLNVSPVRTIEIASNRADFPEPFELWLSASILFPKMRVVTPWVGEYLNSLKDNRSFAYMFFNLHIIS